MAYTITYPPEMLPSPDEGDYVTICVDGVPYIEIVDNQEFWAFPVHAEGDSGLPGGSGV